MPRIHIFMQHAAVDAHLQMRVPTPRYHYLLLDDGTSIEDFVANLVLAAFNKFGLELIDGNVVRYEVRVTNSMPVDMSVNVTAWYTPERAPHFEAIRQEILAQLTAWAPDLKIEVHLVVIGVPAESGSSRARASAGVVHEIAEGDADFRRASRGR